MARTTTQRGNGGKSRKRAATTPARARVTEGAAPSSADTKLFATKNDLPEDKRVEVIGLLNQRLAEAIDLQTQCKQAHWNVKGPAFIALHKLFDDVNEDVEEYVDLIAERVVQLGDQIHVFLHVFIDVIEQLVERDERRALHVPVRLLALRLEIDRLGEALIEQPDHFDSGFFGQVVLGRIQLRCGGRAGGPLRGARLRLRAVAAGLARCARGAWCDCAGHRLLSLRGVIVQLDDVASVGRFSVAETFNRIHIPASPCPGTAQKIMYDPVLLATNRIESASPAPCPCINRVVMARGKAGGSTGPAGIGFVVSTTSTECGRFGSLFVKRMTTVQFVGTVNVNLPSLKPLKFRPPFSCVRPAVNCRVAVLAVVSTVSQLQSIADCVADAAAGGFCAAQSCAANRNVARNAESLVICPRYL